MHIYVQAEIESEEEQEARTPLSDVREDDELWGEVTKVSNYGAFVDVGVEVQGFLHIIYYPKRGPVRCFALACVAWKCLYPRTEHGPDRRAYTRTRTRTYQGALTQDVFYPGQRLRLWAMEVDNERRRLKLTGDRPRSLPRVDYSWYLGGEDVEPVGPSEGRASYAGAGLQSYEDGQGLQPRGRGKKAWERMQSWQLDEKKKEEDKSAVYDLDAKRAAREQQEE